MIECAVLADGSQPALAFLLALKERRLANDPDDSGSPPDGQLDDYFKILEAFRQLAQHGEPKNSGQVNYLEDGVWESKRASKRLTWYDTDGVGGYESKPRHRDAAQAPQPGLAFWWFPTFDRYLRVGHCFLKSSQRTHPDDIGKALLTRMEDLNHDRPDIP